MATTLRHALERSTQAARWQVLSASNVWRAIALAGVALVFAPLLPGLFWALAPGLSLDVWRSLLANSEWPLALVATLTSSILSTLAALLLAGAMAMQSYPGTGWGRLQQRLTLVLSVPHAAFAVGLFFLLSPSGWLARLIAQFLGWVTPPSWEIVQDPLGLSLALGLAIKESWFLLWALGAVLGEHSVARQMTIARSLGYSRFQAWRYILWPQLLSRLSWPLAAVFAYGLSVVDMAIILGPSNPPTLAVLIWRWLIDASPEKQALGSAAGFGLVLVLLAVVLGVRKIWTFMCRIHWHPMGQRVAVSKHTLQAWLYQPIFFIGYLVVAALLIWSIAGTWFFPAFLPEELSLNVWQHADFNPFVTSFWLGAVVCLITLPITLLWLEWGPSRFNVILYLPLIVPALPLAMGQYAALLHTELDGTALGLIWSHLLWVLPYMVLTLIGPYLAFDARLMTTAQAFGRSRLEACLSVKWPILFKPLLAALAVGFAVSIAQYLPTLFAGGGRFTTVTTEAVALSAGGNRRVLAVQALLQVALPLAAFGLATWLPYWIGKRRRGLR